MNLVTSYMQVGATAGVLGGFIKGNGNLKTVGIGLALGATGGYLLDQTPSIVSTVVFEALKKGALGASVGGISAGFIGFNMFNNDKCIDGAAFMGISAAIVGAVAGGVFGLLS